MAEHAEQGSSTYKIDLIGDPMRIFVLIGAMFLLACSPAERSTRAPETPVENEPDPVAVLTDAPARSQALASPNQEPIAAAGPSRALPPNAFRVTKAARSRRNRRRLSRSERRDRVWALDRLPQNEAEATALMRIWVSEVELANERDMIGIWQVIQNVRAEHCDNTRFGSRSRLRISQCRTTTGEIVEPPFEGSIENAQETYLSAMRRLSRRAIGTIPPRSARGRWVQEITLECQRPASWNRRRHWESVLQPLCIRFAPLARGLISGAIQRRITRARVIAWGGRCERHCTDPTDQSTCRQTGACDDGIACRRGLARIQSRTSNAFWCRPGTTGCPRHIDPICRVFGVPVPPEGQQT